MQHNGNSKNLQHHNIEDMLPIFGVYAVPYLIKILSGPRNKYKEVDVVGIRRGSVEIAQESINST